MGGQVMRKTIGRKRIQISTFGFAPKLLTNAIENLPPTAIVISLCTVTARNQMWIDIEYYTQPDRKHDDA